MAKFKVGDRVKSSGMRDVFVVKRVMRVGDFSFDSNLKAEAEKAYAKGDVGYEVYDEDDSDEVTYLFEKDDHLTLANSRACNGKFQVGDKVWVPAKQKRGVIRGVSATGNQYDVEFMGGGGAYVNEEGLEFLQALGNSAPVSANSVVRNALAANARVARNATDADVARYLAAAKDRIRAEVVALKDVAGLLKMEPVPPSAEKAYAKVVKAMASLQKAFAELS